MLQTNVSSDALRAFVKMHEDKLNAKIHDMRANHRRTRVHDALKHDDMPKLIDG